MSAVPLVSRRVRDALYPNPAGTDRAGEGTPLLTRAFARDAIGPLQRLPFRFMLGRICDDEDAQTPRNARRCASAAAASPGR